MRVRLGGALAVVVGCLLTLCAATVPPALAQNPDCAQPGVEPSLSGLPSTLVWERTYTARVDVFLPSPNGVSVQLASADSAFTPAYPAQGVWDKEYQAMVVKVRAARGEGPLVLKAALPDTDETPYYQKIPCVRRWTSNPYPSVAGGPPLVRYQGAVRWQSQYDTYMPFARDKAARFRLTGTQRCAGRAVLEVGPLKLESGEGCVWSESEWVAPGGWRGRFERQRLEGVGVTVLDVSLRGRAVKTRRVRWKVTYGGRTVRSGRLAFERRVRRGRPERKIFADTNVDGYINICVNEGKTVYSQQGGRVYCWSDGYADRWYTRVRRG